LVLVNYHRVAELLDAAHGPGLEIRRIPYAAPAAFKAESDAFDGCASGDGPLIVSVSRHDARKGVDILLRALAMLAADGVAFRACLLGPGRLIEAHRGLANRLGLSDRVSIPGYVPNVMPYLRRADLFVLPSLQEGSGSLSLLEALQAGAAVIASACDGIPEDIRDGEHGLLVEPGDVQALAVALRKLLQDPQLRLALAGRGQRLYARRFSKQAFTDALRDVYADVAASVR
jgi:glycosyltransferase involved in cell wall biosynthesis